MVIQPEHCLFALSDNPFDPSKWSHTNTIDQVITVKKENKSNYIRNTPEQTTLKPPQEPFTVTVIQTAVT